MEENPRDMSTQDELYCLHTDWTAGTLDRKDNITYYSDDEDERGNCAEISAHDNNNIV